MSRKSVSNYAQHGVYKISHPTGLYYVGLHSSDDERCNSYMGSGVKLKEAYKKYPKKEWRKELIKIFDKREYAQRLEGILITEKELADPNCLNSIRGKHR